MYVYIFLYFYENMKEKPEEASSKRLAAEKFKQNFFINTTKQRTITNLASIGV